MVARGWDITDADPYKYFALISSIPVALFALRFCFCWCINDAETSGMSNLVPSSTLLPTKSCSLVQLSVFFTIGVKVFIK